MSKTEIRIAGLSEEEFQKLKAQKPEKIDNPLLDRLVAEIMNGPSDHSHYVQEIISGTSHIPKIGPRDIDLQHILRKHPTEPQALPKKKEKLARLDQITKERCQVAAKLLWKENPTMTIADVARHPNVDNSDITEARRYDQRTVRDWVAEAFPDNLKKQVGRRKKLK